MLDRLDGHGFFGAVAQYACHFSIRSNSSDSDLLTHLQFTFAHRRQKQNPEPMTRSGPSRFSHRSVAKITPVHLAQSYGRGTGQSEENLRAKKFRGVSESRI